MFVSKSPSEEEEFLIRWFTPLYEAALCGHATLVTSYILRTEKHIYSELLSNSKEIKFRAYGGVKLQVTFEQDENGKILPTMNFPLNTPVPLKATGELPQIAEIKSGIFGPEQADEGLVVDVQWSPSLTYLLLRAKDGFDIGQLKPNFSRLLEVATKREVSLVIVTGKSTNFSESGGVHFNVRVFAPWYGANEDPVCGSAFTVSTPYWAKVLAAEEGGKGDSKNQTVFYAYHASKRSGIVRTELLPGGERMLIGGRVNKFCSGVMKV